MSDSWYFAYGSNFAHGSNMCIDRKTVRTGDIRASLRCCRLPGYRLAFNKLADSRDRTFANIVLDPTGTVWGVAYRCNEEAMTKLDRCEGVRDGHYRQMHVGVVTDDGEALRAVAYIADDEKHLSGMLLPRKDYLDMVLRGARAHDLPEEYIRFIEKAGTLQA
jgi:cation transport regulator ChaC